MNGVIFYLFGGLAILSALNVILASKPTRALLSLIVTMFGLAVTYLLLGAYFVAMVHLIVYAGAVLVLFLFVIMLQGTSAKEISLFDRFSKSQLFLSGIAAIAFMALVLYLLHQNAAPAAAGYSGHTEAFGLTLFRDYLLPFELTSLLLLIGVFAAVGLAKKDTE